ncbi:MAG TPA: BTAD domain-containing putative transcriptional regulator [Jiangellales bacterium]|nr:BTAD domain-containing putative transcriptional regulator [Jiangellales bacterium]
MAAPIRVQLCGHYRLYGDDGERFDDALPGPLGRLLVAYLVLRRPSPVTRDELVEALWPGHPPTSRGSALTVLLSRVRSALRDHVRGRGQLTIVLPAGSTVDVETAYAALHSAQSAVAQRDWRRAWAPALTAMFISRRRLLPEADVGWVEQWRAGLEDVHIQALESYARACLGLGGTELASAERAARRLVELAPLRESGQLVLVQTLAASGNVAEALAAYERLRVTLREQLGTDPGPEMQLVYAELLARR